MEDLLNMGFPCSECPTDRPLVLRKLLLRGDDRIEEYIGSHGKVSDGNSCYKGKWGHKVVMNVNGRVPIYTKGHKGNWKPD